MALAAVLAVGGLLWFRPSAKPEGRKCAGRGLGFGDGLSWGRGWLLVLVFRYEIIGVG